MRIVSQCLLVVVAVFGIPSQGDRAVASPPNPARAGSLEASTSETARRDAMQSIPLERLAPEDRAKVNSVLSNVSIFRRLPVKVVDCDPDLYLFLVRHPDVVINIWEMMRVSRLELRQTEPPGPSLLCAYVVCLN